MSINAEVLNYLDSVATGGSTFTPLGLHSPYEYLADAKLHIFSNKHDWAIVLERLLCNPRERQVMVDLLYYGNCLENLTKYDDGTSYNGKQIVLFTEVLRDPERQDMSRVSKVLSIRDKPLTDEIVKELSQINSLEWGEHAPMLVRAIRYLADSHLSGLGASIEEVRTCIPSDLPWVLTLNEWHHDQRVAPSSVDQEIMPSECDTYQMVADVICFADSTRYVQRLPPNSNWRFWPDSGAL